MKHTRVRFVVELNLDPVPGFNHEPQDFANHMRHDLTRSIPWYEPTVSPAQLVEQVQAA